jgi:hypothetical protein
LFLLRRLLVVELVIGFAAAPASAQDRPLLLEGHGGIAVPVGSFAESSALGRGATAGPTLSVLFAVPGDGRRTLYAGFSQSRFGCEDAGCSPDGRFVATGFNVGLRFALLPGRMAMPWIRIGAITTRVETDDLPAPDAGVSDLGVGGEAGAGVYIGGDGPVAVNPAVTFSVVNSTLPGGSTLGLRYLTAQLGIVVAF